MLLDTHIWYRWLGKNDLPERIIHQIENADELFVSATSCWELAQLVKRNRIKLSMPLQHWIKLASMDIEILPITKEIALLSEQLDNHHKDPADRFIIATGVFYQMPIVSLDTIFPKYDEIKHLLIN